MPPQYVYTMKGLGKRYPPDRTVLKDIWLSFLPGAKIGVLGANGAGKSTLLRIMAGEITEFDGEAFPGPGALGRLPAAGAAARPVEDRLGQRQRGRGGHAGTAAALRPDRRRPCLERPGIARDGGGARGAGRAAVEDRSHRRLGSRLACPDGDGCAAAAARLGRRHDAVGRGAPAGGALPAAAAVARSAAARRADQPPRRRVGRLARALPGGLPGDDRGRHPRPVLSRQRRRLDPGARPLAPGFPGRATTRRGWRRSSSGSTSRPSTRRSGGARCSASWSGSRCRRAPGRRRGRRG